MRKRLIAVWWTACMLLLAVRATAQTFEMVQAFSEIPKSPADRLLEVGDGIFYGTTAYGGAFAEGTVFILARGSNSEWTTTTIHSFTGADGAYPLAGLIAGRDGNLYGTTPLGGASNLGTVYKMTPLGAVTVLHSFSGSDGDTPTKAVVQAADGTLWGATGSGVFQVSTTGSAFAWHPFGPLPGPSGASSLIEGSDGNLYGVSYYGGSHGPYGTAYRVTPSGTISVIFNFGDIGGPSQPLDGLVEGPDGAFYGVSDRNNSFATVFRLTKAGTLTVIHVFSDTEGVPFRRLTIGADGQLYGATWTVPSIFKTDTNGNFTTLAGLGSIGALPSALTLARDGMLYGETYWSPVSTPTGRRAGFGSVYAMDASGSVNLIHSFVSDQPLHPMGRLLDDSGSIFGTSCGGGLYGDGAVFRVTSTSVTTIHSFSFDDGVCPIAGLVRGPDGAFYGTTYRGGSASSGTLFRITATGEFTLLHSFTGSHIDSPPGDGLFPVGRMTLGADGYLYGTTTEVLNGSGNIFRATPSGEVAVMHDFAPTESWYPLGNLTTATDGAVYGTTYGDLERDLPAARRGMLFRMDADGSVSTLYTFTTERGNPTSVVQGADGNLYGTSQTGGAVDAGFIFKSTLQGSVSILHEFNLVDGSAPMGELVEGAGGAFYGTTAATTSAPQVGGFGTVFRMSADGTISTLHRFLWLDGANPVAGLVRASDGSLYGTTRSGTLGGGGAIFKISSAP